jgi:hypothetical protein
MRDQAMALAAEIEQLKSTPRYYRLRELAKIWGKHPSAFTRYILQPKNDAEGTYTLEAIRTPGEWLVPEGAVERYFARVTRARTGNAAPTPKALAAARERELARTSAELDVVFGPR